MVDVARLGPNAGTAGESHESYRIPPGRVPYQAPSYRQRSPKISLSRDEKIARITGVIQFACGIASILVGILISVRHGFYGTWGAGMICGLLLFWPTGIVGFNNKDSNSCRTIAYIVMSTLSSLVAALCLVFYSLKLHRIGYLYYSETFVKVLLAVGILVFLLELVTSAVAVGFGCSLCPCRASHRNSHRNSPSTNEVSWLGPSFITTFPSDEPPSYAESRSHVLVTSNAIVNTAAVPSPIMTPCRTESSAGAQQGTHS